MINRNHTLEYYRQKEVSVFPNIPGMKEILTLAPGSTENLAEKYRDAAFALLTAGDLVSGDRERNAINQEAYFEILQGKNITDIRLKSQNYIISFLKLASASFTMIILPSLDFFLREEVFAQVTLRKLY